jgi:hypothetical protein
VILLHDIENAVPGKDKRNYSYLVSELFSPVLSAMFGKQTPQVSVSERAQYLSDRVFESTVSTICRDDVNTLSAEDFEQFIQTIEATGGCHRNLSVVDALIYRGRPGVGQLPGLKDLTRNEKLQDALYHALAKIMAHIDDLDDNESAKLRNMVNILCVRDKNLADSRRMVWYGMLKSGIEGSSSTHSHHHLLRSVLTMNALAAALSGPEVLFRTLKNDMVKVPVNDRKPWLEQLNTLVSDVHRAPIAKERVLQVRIALNTPPSFYPDEPHEASAPPLPEVASAPPMPDEASAPFMPDDWLAPAKDLEPSVPSEPNVVVLESAPQQVVQVAMSAAQEKLYDDICAELELEDAISSEVFVDPVVTADGQTYENSSITGWLTNNRRSPLTNQELPHTTLVRNVLLKNVMNAIRQHVHDHEDATQDSVKDAILPLLSYQDPVIALESKGGFEMGHTYERSAIEEAQERPEVAPNWKVKELLGTP